MAVLTVDSGCLRGLDGHAMRKSSARAGNIARTSVRSRAVFFGASFFYLFTCEYSLSIVLCGLTSPLTTEHPEVVDTPSLLGESGWMKYACSCLAVLAFLLPVALSAQTAPAAKSWNLLWSDEFSGTALDASKWVYDIGGGKWGNQELEYYTDRPENIAVSDGNLVITARSEKIAAPITFHGTILRRASRRWANSPKLTDDLKRG